MANRQPRGASKRFTPEEALMQLISTDDGESEIFELEEQSGTISSVINKYQEIFNDTVGEESDNENDESMIDSVFGDPDYNPDSSLADTDSDTETDVDNLLNNVAQRTIANGLANANVTSTESNITQNTSTYSTVTQNTTSNSPVTGNISTDLNVTPNVTTNSNLVPNAATDSTVRPNASTDSTVTPHASTDSTVRPNASTDSTVTPHASTDSTVRPNASTDSTVTPHASTDLTVTPHASTGSTVTPHASTDSTVTPHASTDSTVTPHASTDSTVTPHASTDLTVTPHASTGSTVTPHASTDSTVRPNVSNDSTVTPHASTDSTVRPNASNDSTVTPNASTDSTVTPNVSTDSTVTPHASTDPNSSSNTTPTTSADEPRGRKRKRNESEWKRNIRYRNRNSGQEYVNRSGKNVEIKKPVDIDCKCIFKCSDKFPKETRESICREYYSLAEPLRQKGFIAALVDETSIKRPRSRTGEELPKKQISYAYYLTLNAERKRVCQQFFCKTLAVGNRQVYSAVKGKGESGIYVGSDGRSGKVPVNKIGDERLQHVRQHINSFPRIEPHYCRRDTNKQYLSPELNVSQMYCLYVEYCNENQIANPVNEHKYRDVFVTEFNLKCFQPKKDQCTVCNAFNEASGICKDEQRANYEQHKEREKESMEEKTHDKEKAKVDNNFHAVTFDLQAVLTTPYAGDSQIYYKRKLAVYNFTVYDSASGDGNCYLWDETEGNRGANEIASCVFDYLQNLPQTVTHFSSFSDTCSGQNRNQFIAGAMLYAVQKTRLETIDLKYMESGHSYLEVDSMHATIENARKHQKIYTPREWEILITGARKRPRPYNVKMLKHTDFKDMKKVTKEIISNRTKSTTGEAVNWLNIKQLRFQKSKPYVIEYKYRLRDDEFMEMNVLSTRGRPKTISAIPLSPLYTSRLPITQAKKKDLLSLLESHVIRNDYRDYYEGLPASKRGTEVSWE